MTARSMLPVSFSQELLWLIDRAAPGSSAYNVPRTRRLRGRLDVARLQRAFDALAARHEILRTTYGFAGERPVQVVHPPCGVRLTVVDLSRAGAPEPVAAVDAQVRAWSATAFDLACEVPLRVGLIRLSADDHVLHIDTHHIASDGGSRDILLRELDVFYAADAAGVRADLASLPVQYADYAIWEREHLSGDRLEALLRYWREELAGVGFGLKLPADFPRPEIASDDAVTRTLLLSPSLSASVRALGGRYEATPYMTLLAAYQSVLQRYTGQPDVLVGSPVAGRVRPETEGLIGYFTSMVVLRARFASDPTFGELLTQVRRSSLGAYDHRELPFEKLVLELRGGAETGRSPSLQAVFTMLERADPATARLGDVEVLPFRNELASTKFDLTLFATERPEGLLLSARARSALWAPQTLERFLGHFLTLLAAAADDPERRVSALPLLTAAEEGEFARWNAAVGSNSALASNEVAGSMSVPTSLHAAIEATVARVPGRTAVVGDDGEFSFSELDARAATLAHRLRRRGVASGARVGLLFERSRHSLVALLGILKAGAAYVPLSPDAPAARLALQIAEAGIGHVVTLAAHAVALPRVPGLLTVCLDDEAVLEEALDEKASDEKALDEKASDEKASDEKASHEKASHEKAMDGPGSLAGRALDALAYVLFTSGSTGVPKGVAVTHANALHYVRAISDVLGGAVELDGLHFATAGTLAADLGNTAIFPALCYGGTLHLLGLETARDAERFATYSAALPIDVLKLTPTHLRALAAAGESAGPVGPLPRRWLILGGEALPFDLAQRIAAEGTCRVLNHYGPTETTVGACTFEVTSESLDAARAMGAQTVPIGTPLGGVRCDVLDARGRLVPVGVPGELFIGGTGVARGYVNAAGPGAERFTRTAFGPYYRTGDRVRRLPSGALEFLGRLDGQVKIRGHRVDVGEVEAALAAFPGIAQTAVRAWADDNGNSLAAYVVTSAAARAAGDDTRARLLRFLVERLPEYMLPRSIAFLESLPLGPNGKVDRAALPEPGDAQAQVVRVAPRTAVETVLAEIWAEAMRRDVATFGVHDSFLALGGHSLLAIRILGTIKRRFGVRLALRALFDAPTLAELAVAIERETQASAPAEPALVRVARSAYRHPQDDHAR